MRLCVSVCECMCVYVGICLSVCMYVCECVCIRIHVWMRVDVCMHVCVCVCVDLCVHVRVCVYVCVILTKACAYGSLKVKLFFVFKILCLLIAKKKSTKQN